MAFSCLIGMVPAYKVFFESARRTQIVPKKIVVWRFID
jgi:hypothetical protein